MDIKVDFNFLPFTKAMEGAYKNQFPFAAARALTKTAKQAQVRIQRELPSIFTIRNRGVVTGIKINPATKRHLEAEVGSIDAFMRLQVTGGIKRGERKGESRAVPSKEIRPTFSAKVPKGKRPKALLAKKAGKGAPFRMTLKDGREAVVRRKRGGPLKFLWFMPKEVKVSPKLALEGLTEETMGRHWQDNMIESLDLALKTAR